MYTRWYDELHSHDDILVFWQSLCELHTAPQTVRTFQSWDDPLELSDHLECLEALEIVRDNVFGSARVMQVRVLGSDRVVVEAWGEFCSDVISHADRMMVADKARPGEWYGLENKFHLPAEILCVGIS